MKRKSYLIILSALLAVLMVFPSFAAYATGTEEIIALRVGTYNIQNGQNPGVAHDFSVIAQDILGAGLDIVGLQEVDKNTTRNGGQDTMAIRAGNTEPVFFRSIRSNHLKRSSFPAPEREEVWDTP